jgi:hypothetical protein
MGYHNIKWNVDLRVWLVKRGPPLKKINSQTTLGTLSRTWKPPRMETVISRRKTRIWAQAIAIYTFLS